MYTSNARATAHNYDVILNGENAVTNKLKRGPKPTVLLFNSMSDLRTKNKELGHLFFDHETMKFWGSKIETALFRGVYFITSEKGATQAEDRRFTIRQARPTGEIITVGRGREYKSLDEAKDAVKDMIRLLNGITKTKPKANGKKAKKG